MNRRIDIIREDGGGGFTLVELLIAMAVAALLMVSLLSILSKSMDVSKGANASMMSKASAQAALDLMVTDLDSLVVSRNAGEVLRLLPNTPVPGAASAVTNTVMYLLTTSMIDSYSTDGISGNPGMPRLVQYEIRYASSYASRSNGFILYRNVVDPTNTFSSAIGASNLSNAVASSEYTNYPLVPNVVAMNVNLYTNYGYGLSSSTSINSTNFPPGVVVEIALTVLDDPYIQRFGAGAGSGNNSPASLIKQYGRTLVRRVSLPSPP